MSYSFAILFSCGLVGMVIGFLIGLACNGDVKKLNETINELEDGVEYWQGECDKIAEVGYRSACELIEAKAEVNRLSDLVATLQAKVPARNARGKFVAR